MGMEQCGARLLELLKEDALAIGKVILSSGKESDYYLDERMVTLSAEGAYLAAKLILDMLKDVQIDAIGGPTLAADPIVGAVIALSHADGCPVNGFIVRKEPKGHGMGKQVEGPIADGSRVVVVDGTMTTGGSILKAIDVVEGMGCEVVKVILLIDRMEGGREKIESKGYEFAAIFTRDDLLGE
jgi:orotate phosphoribosyltransferase